MTLSTSQTPLPSLLHPAELQNRSFRKHFCKPPQSPHALYYYALPALLILNPDSIQTSLFFLGCPAQLDKLHMDAGQYHFNRRSSVSVEQWVEFSNFVTFSSLYTFYSLGSCSEILPGMEFNLSLVCCCHVPVWLDMSRELLKEGPLKSVYKGTWVISVAGFRLHNRENDGIYRSLQNM